MPDEVLIAGGGIAIKFYRMGDRFYAIGWLDTGAFVPALESVEGTPSDSWPASPPLQSLHCEDRPDGKRLALLVGMSGRSHWSLSVEVDPARSVIAFDAACRLHDEPGALTSTYRIRSELLPAARPLRFRDPFSNEWELRGDGASELSFSSEADDSPVLRISCSVQQIAIPHTARWQYLLCRVAP